MTKKTVFKGVTAAGSAAALLLSLAPAFALADDKGQTNVINANNGTSSTSLVIAASTGGNTALGGNSGNAANGGDVTASGNGNTGGMGGAAGMGGAGGTVTSGNATLRVSVDNRLNMNDVAVDRTAGVASYQDIKGDDNLTNDNVGVATFTGVVAATTGDNFVDGGFGGNGSFGGNVSDSGKNNTGGNGGTSGDAGAGGTVTSGAVSAVASIVTLINSNLVRVLR
jgi:hypothetical protein